MPITKATASSIAPAAKGDLVVGSATNDAAVLGVGSNNQVLTADSSTATGLKWATASAGGMTLINTGGTSLSGSSTSITSIPGTYKNLYVVVENAVNSVNNEYMYLQINSDTGSNYFYQGLQLYRDSGVSAIRNASASLIFLCYFGTGTDWFRKCNGTITIPRYAESEIHTVQANLRAVSDANIEQYMFNVMGLLNSTSAITSLEFKTTGGTFSSGKVYVYGVS